MVCPLSLLSGVQSVVPRSLPTIRLNPIPSASPVAPRIGASGSPAHRAAGSTEPRLEAIAAALAERWSSKRESVRAASPAMTSGQHERVAQLRAQLGTMLDVRMRTNTGFAGARCWSG